MKAREIALLALQETEKNNTKSEQSLHRLLDKHNPDKNDRSLATELVNGILRFRLKLDFMIGRYYHHDFNKAAPVLQNILRLGTYQLLFLDKIPGWAAVDECVKLARKYKGRHISGIVNGVLRKIASEPASTFNETLEKMPLHKRLSIEQSHPQWLVERWLDVYGEEKTRSMLTSNNASPLTALRINTLKTSPETMFAALKDASVTFSTCMQERFILTRDFDACKPFIHLGLLTVQNPTQAIPCLLLNPLPGDTVLDMCAAPGGKTTFLAEMMQNKGSLIAVDRYPNKCKKIIQRANALDIKIIQTVVADARTIQPEKPPNAVLLDAPCTGTGVLGRKTELRWRTSPEKLKELTLLQSELLDHAAGLLDSGGILVYATCSVEPEENALQIERFLKRHPDFTREPAPVSLSLTDVNEINSSTGSCLTLPGEYEGFDGGFTQRLRKKR
ncbi:16S rRNA (cytosine(967)-C(5))-methyltransferase RsmB [Prosthecochloris sp. SCSIO W1103]|uniref:16S rRNA (cytosine(967)-C(5))-methyltransferase RsmB n=1 Tax=Prosthecochloris sp. SCSIO W1103 TaxID=2992244 RepID=UPI00223CF42B|nr:16S rRNA (cytosine(967)-C(5))-methyltransferase RsmB [Prosthecochloris sp. SCSIO W1103]UZJ36985.1 16S rRNA (cytosine(967)-C(5))-methyltransferase RsmB [Prosthecochloris sp. SCSIO W1103]